MAEDVILVTTQRLWESLGILTNANCNGETALAVAQRSFAGANALTSTVSYIVPSGINSIEVRFKLATDNHDVDIDVWASRGPDDDLKRVCTLGVINGTQDVGGSSTLHYADNITITNNEWLKTVSRSPSTADTEQQATLFVDLCGYSRVLFHGFGTFDGDTTVEVAGC